MTQSPRFSLATVVLDCPDAHALSDFYRRLLGWEVKWSEPDWVLLRGPEGGTSLSFQSEADYRPPVWPELPGEQQKMQHLDIEVDDLDEAGAHAVAEGATLADFNRRTMFASTSTLPGTPSACSSGEGAALFTTGDPLADAGQHIIDVVTAQAAAALDKGPERSVVRGCSLATATDEATDFGYLVAWLSCLGKRVVGRQGLEPCPPD